MREGKISDRVLEDGDGSECAWVSERDWAYAAVFDRPDHPGLARLVLKGLDTVCDIYLNGVHIGGHRTMYLPFEYDLPNDLPARNELLVYFHNHRKILSMYEAATPEAWRGRVQTSALMRKAHDYAAPKGYSPIGLFDDAFLELSDSTRLTDFHFDVRFDHRLTRAEVLLYASGTGKSDGIVVSFRVSQENGSNLLEERAAVSDTADGWSASASITINDPKLWYPRNLGAQPLYLVRCGVSRGGVAQDGAERLTGLRFIRQIGSMKFEVNGKIARLYGADFAPIYGPANKFNKDYALMLAERYVQMGATSTRMWGPTKPYGEAIYEYFDRHGILVWQDFPTGGSELPDSREYIDLYMAEAAHLIQRLRHHPCILLWNGGNENIYMCEVRETDSRVGFDLLTRHFKELCHRMDPYRYYHVSSPYEGRYTNDPTCGDSHGSRAYGAFMPGEYNGILFTENIRTFPPMEKSFLRWAPNSIWEDGYVDTQPFGNNKPMPLGWQERLGNSGELKLGRIQDYYAGTNPYELIYKFTMAAAQDISECILGSRRGNPPWKSWEERTATGHMFWKFNDPWPHFYCSMVDYYGENTLAYYVVKRALRPVQVDLDLRDHIYAWGINDTAKPFQGTLVLIQFSLERNREARRVELPVGIAPDQSVILTDLDMFGYIRWKSVLYAELRDESGTVVSSCFRYVTTENLLPFPDAHITMAERNGFVEISTDAFARCVELSGGEDGMEFGWQFDDNYFDLLPGQIRRVTLTAPKGSSLMRAKAHYSGTATLLKLSPAALV